jgi:flagellar basal body-associated protein FliL
MSKFIKIKKDKKKIITLLVIILIIIISLISFFIIRNRSKNSQLPSQPQNQSVVVQEIDWTTASNLIKNCQIRVIFQAKTLQLNLRGFDNQLYYTLEPKFNDVVDLAKKVQGPCDIIQIVTE